MESVCAWCGRVKDLGGGKIDGKVSHGICVACAVGLKKEGKIVKWSKNLDKERKELLKLDRGESV